MKANDSKMKSMIERSSTSSMRVGCTTMTMGDPVIDLCIGDLTVRMYEQITYRSQPTLPDWQLVTKSRLVKLAETRQEQLASTPRPSAPA
jgi:hypothetical protein